jgi:hypothetical protein
MITKKVRCKMQIVIDIPDRIYKINQNRRLNITDAEILEKAVRNGIPLDKIRAEIEQKIIKRPYLNFKEWERCNNDTILEVLDIIDKYKAESEVEE